MLRKLAFALLVITSVSSCAQMSTKLAASQYCLVQGGGPCSQMSGDGFCEPCP